MSRINRTIGSPNEPNNAFIRLTRFRTTHERTHRLGLVNAGSVRSSLARRLGLVGDQRVSQRSEGLAELMLDATRQHLSPLSLERLLHWHTLLFPAEETVLMRGIRVGTLRGEEAMQVVSGGLVGPPCTLRRHREQGWTCNSLVSSRGSGSRSTGAACRR